MKWWPQWGEVRDCSMPISLLQPKNKLQGGGCSASELIRWVERACKFKIRQKWGVKWSNSCHSRRRKEMVSWEDHPGVGVGTVLSSSPGMGWSQRSSSWSMAWSQSGVRAGVRAELLPKRRPRDVTWRYCYH